MFKNIINKPVLATVMSILLCIAGVLGLVSLPITQYPSIAPPVVQVSASYPGANAESVLKSVIAPLEEQINGVEGMTYMSSSADNNGSATIKVYFGLGTDPNMAAVNVQNRVSAASSKLPSSVTSYGVTTEKVENSMLLMMAVYSENPDFDAVFVENYLRINIYPELQRVPGVGKVNIFGLGDYSMRIWIDPLKLASLNMAPTDIIQAIKEQNVDAAPGKFGESSDQAFQYTIKYQGKFTTPEEYGNIVIRASEDGSILKLKDVATVELGAFSYAIKSTADDMPGTVFAIYQMSGSNAQQVVKDLLAKMDQLSTSFPPGLKWMAPYNTNKFLDASIHQVLKTLLEAFLLVFLVVFIFLQDFRSTLIPAIAATVALVGTLFFLLLLGFTINMLTLFALVLAIGIVVDDAIVVVEAVHAKLAGGEHNVKKATQEAMGEITGAIVSISLIMSAVFVPVSFMSGPSGMFFKQFALTLAVSVILSAFNALTLSPVLCVMLIKHKAPQDGKKPSLLQRFQLAFNTAFESITEKYGRSLGFFSRKTLIPIGVLVLFALGFVGLMKITPSAFIPNEDQGLVMMDLTMPAGTSLERTTAVLADFSESIKDIPYIDQRMTVAGSSLMTGNMGGSYGLSIMSLIDWDERKGVTYKDVIGMMQQKTAHIKDGKMLFFVPPPVSGFGISDGFEMQLQDKTGGDLATFYKVQQDFIAELSKRPEIQYANSGFDVNFPQYEFTVNVDKCKLAGINISDVFNTLQIYYGSSVASDFNRFTKYYRVVVQADVDSRKDISSLDQVNVRNSKGEMVPITSLVSFKRVYGPEALSRYNLFTSATITGGAAAGYSSGDAINAINEVGASLPSGYGFDFSGMTREEQASGGQSTMIFVLCFVFVYLLLSAQYESYILPWAVLLSLFLGMCGVFISINIFGIDNNIYVQVALIMLIGLLAKNGILIVEYAVQRRKNGMRIGEAAIEGAKARLRPILMTSFAFIFGMLPLIVEKGAGAVGNASIGVAAAGGMLIGTALGIFVIPIMFIIFQTLDEKTRKKEVHYE